MSASARSPGRVVRPVSRTALQSMALLIWAAGVKVWRNVGSGDATKPVQMGNWLAIQPTQTGPNRDAIGARIEVKVGETTMRRELTVGGGHAGGQIGPTHFGLGTAGEAQVRVLWPDGSAGSWMTVSKNQFVVIDRGATEARPWSPPQS